MSGRNLGEGGKDWVRKFCGSHEIPFDLGRVLFQDGSESKNTNAKVNHPHRRVSKNARFVQGRGRR